MILYIDPGTGSMLFSVIIGLTSALYFIGKAFIIKFKFIFTGRGTKTEKALYPLVIYSEGNQYWTTFKPILDALENREIATVFYTSDKDDPALTTPYTFIQSEFIGEGNKAYTRLNFLEADVCLMTTPGLDVYQLKRSKGVKHYSHILHAPTDATTYRLFGLDYFDSVLLTGDYQKEHLQLLETQRAIDEKELVTVGCPYLDFAQETITSMNILENDSFTILVAPSWGESSLLHVYGTQLLDKLIDTGFHIIVRPHPQSKIVDKELLKNIDTRYKSHENFEWDLSSDNTLSMAKSHIMISDFSGILFDYVFLFNKPIMYALKNFEPRLYDLYDLPEEPWIFKVLPTIGIELNETHFDTFKTTLLDVTNSERFATNRMKAKETAWQFQKEGGEKVADFLVSTLKELQS